MFLTQRQDLSGFHAPDALRTAHWDTLEKALTVFILPQEGTRRRLHRRLDLIFASPEAYWTAVVGWYFYLPLPHRVRHSRWPAPRTGSKMFERDLRKWAKDKK